MRIVSTVLAVFLLSLVVAPSADALMWSSFSAATSKYDIRAAIKAKKDSQKRPASVELPAIAKGGLLFGDSEATTTIVMFSDIQCPFCKRFSKDTYPSIKKDYLDTSKVRFVVRHFPLSFHKNARPAAETVVCARAAGDAAARTLYEKLMAMPTLDGAKVEAAIVDLGLDADTVATCMDSDKTQKTIDADIQAGTNAKVAGTPTFFIVGPTGITKQITGAYPYDTFKKAIEDVQKK